MGIQINGQTDTISAVDNNFSLAGNVSIGGTLTYEDVTSVDAVGLSTFKAGIQLDDSITHLGDTDTKIRFPANDTFTVETAGSERLRITSAGLVGIGSAIPAQALDILNANPAIRLTDTDPSGVFSQIDGAGGDLILTADGGAGSSNSFISFRVDGNDVNAEKVRITSDGSLGINEATPDSKLDIVYHTSENSATANLIHLRADPSGSYASRGLFVKVGRDGAYDNSGIHYDVVGSAGNSGFHAFEVQGTERLRITSDGYARLTTANARLEWTASSGSNPFIRSIGSGQQELEFNTGGTERLRITSAGSAQFTGSVDAADGHVELLLDSGNGRIKLNSSGDATNIDLFGSNGSATFAGGALAIASSGNLSINRTSGTNDVFNGKLNGTATSTINADGSAEFKSFITSDRTQSSEACFHSRLNGSNTSVIRANGSADFNGQVKCIGGTTTANALQISGNNNSAKGIEVYNAGGSLNASIKLDGESTFAGTVTSGTSTTGCQLFTNGSAIGRLSGTQKWYFNNNGNVVFAGSVTASNVSDIRFKENITDANSQLADAVSLGSQLKNFDWNDDAPLNEELRAKRFLGLVAQEAEKVCPGLTYTVPRTKQGEELTPETTDAEGNVIPATYEEIDDSYKAINHDILVMKLLGAVSEQNTQIETLKTQNASLEARLTALEGS